LLLAPAPATSQTIQKARLKKGKQAPFDGTLLSSAALAKIITGYEAQIKTLQAKLEKQEREAKARGASAAAICKAKLDGADAKLRAAQKGCDSERKIWDRALTDATAPVPWYKTPYVHFILGNLVAGGLCVGANRLE
jgi:hypothetical protein